MSKPRTVRRVIEAVRDPDTFALSMARGAVSRAREKREQHAHALISARTGMDYLVRQDALWSAYVKALADADFCKLFVGLIESKDRDPIEARLMRDRLEELGLADQADAIMEQAESDCLPF